MIKRLGGDSHDERRKDILNKHVRRWATEYYQLFLEDEDEDVVRGALNAYDAVAMLAYELLRTEHSERLVNTLMDSIDELALHDAQEKRRKHE